METRAGTIFVELELLLDAYMRQLEEARTEGERALNGLDSTAVIRAMFDVQALQSSVAEVEGIVAAASEIYGEQASVVVRANLGQLNVDLAEAEAVIMAAVARIRSGTDVSIGLDLGNLARQSDELGNEVSDLADRASEDAVVRPTIDAEGIGEGLDQAVTDATDRASDGATVTPNVDASGIEQGLIDRVRELTEQADREATVTPSVALNVLQANLERANELVAEALASGDREAIVTARIALDLIREDFGTIEDEASLIQLPELRAEVRADIQNVRDGVDEASALLDTVRADEPVQLLLDVATLEAELADIQLSIVEAFRNGDESAVISARLELGRFNSSIEEVRETLENEIPTDQDVEVRARFGNLVGRSVQAQTVIARGFMQATRQAQAAIDELNVEGGRSLTTLGQRVRGAFELRRDNPLVRANVALIATNQAVQTAVNGASIAASVLSGNFEDAADQVKNLPGPIGAMATTLDRALRFATGLTAELQELEESLSRNEANLASRLRIEEVGREGVAAIRDQIRTLRELAEVQTATEDERPQIRLNQLAAERTREAEALVKARLAALNLLGDEPERLKAARQEISNNNAALREQRAELERVQEIGASGPDGGQRTDAIRSATAEIERLERANRIAEGTVANLAGALATQKDILENGRPALLAAVDAANAADQASLDRTRSLAAETMATETQADADARRLASIERLRDAQTELEAFNLRGQGREVEAQNIEIQRAFERRIATLRAQIAEIERLSTSPIESAANTEPLRQEIEIIQNINEQRQAQNIDEEMEARRDALTEINEDIADIQLRGQQALLRSQGRGLEAQLLGINAAYSRRIQEANALGRESQSRLIAEERDAAIELARLEDRLSDSGSVVDITGFRLVGQNIARAVDDATDEIGSSFIFEPIDVNFPEMDLPTLPVEEIPPVEVPDTFDMANAMAPAGQRITTIGVNDDRRDNAIRRVEQAVARLPPIPDGIARLG